MSSLVVQRGAVRRNTQPRGILHLDRRWGTALLLAPAMLFILLWFVIPLARFFSLAFSDQSGTFASFRTLFESQAYRRVLLLTLGNAALVTAITVTLAWPVAYLLSRLRGAWLAFALYGVLFPFWISVLVRTFSWMLLLERHGPINRLLSAT